MKMFHYLKSTYEMRLKHVEYISLSFFVINETFYIGPIYETNQIFNLDVQQMCNIFVNNSTNRVAKYACRDEMNDLFISGALNSVQPLFRRSYQHVKSKTSSTWQDF
ncbi:hypothetical protein EDEG_01610 [Edhazardia aedis USNM 41457]|uniref:Uncharacterized protein n=1 Tax=Edhazardia aedis (strain USNM 41457) TaxID=1003232 RepID=J8ZWQ8_EDHAE|nr:hypothetical protein EDEG_01610 [Edhazardia aedis USNM 41457]|eukprot:EJW04088.1 hypothetical protein EDEG_01610 [Edhazardia aedis USNM 41457]